MEKQTLALLGECTSGCKMAIDSMEQVREYVMDSKLSEKIETCVQKHREFEQEGKRQLQKLGEREKEPEKLAQAFSWFTTEMKLMLKDDHTQIAKLLMDGCNMGVKSLGEQMNKYPEASAASRGLAEKIIKCEEKFMAEVKGFL